MASFQQEVGGWRLRGAGCGCVTAPLSCDVELTGRLAPLLLPTVLPRHCCAQRGRWRHRPLCVRAAGAGAEWGGSVGVRAASPQPPGLLTLRPPLPPPPTHTQSNRLQVPRRAAAVLLRLHVSVGRGGGDPCGLRGARVWSEGAAATEASWRPPVRIGVAPCWPGAQGQHARTTRPCRPAPHPPGLPRAAVHGCVWLLLPAGLGAAGGRAQPGAADPGALRAGLWRG